MKYSLDDEGPDDDQPNRSKALSPQHPPVTTPNDSMPLEEEKTAELSKTSLAPPPRPRRTSVVDVWRKREREGSTASGIAKPNEPSSIVTPRKYQTNFGGGLAAVVVGTSTLQETDPSYSFEEKKEPTSEEEAAWNKKGVASPSPSASSFNPVTPGPFDLGEEPETKNLPKRGLSQSSSFSRSQPEMGASTPQEEDMATSRPRRSGVASSWKKRSSGAAADQEESLSLGRSSKTLPPLPTPSPSRTTNPNVTDRQSFENSGFEPNSAAPAEETPQEPTMTPAANNINNSRAKIRSKWLQRDSSIKSQELLDGDQKKIKNVGSFGSAVSDNPSNAGSRGSVLSRWNNRGQDDRSSPVSTAPADANNPHLQSPVVRRNKGAECSSPEHTSPCIEAPPSPGFGNVRARWAKFGVQKDEARESLGIKNATPSPKLSVGKQWAQRRRGSESTQGDEQDDLAGAPYDTPPRGMKKQSSVTNQWTKPNTQPQEESGTTYSQDSGQRKSLLQREALARKQRRSDKEPESEPFDHNADNSMEETGTPTKKNLVKMGQLHAARPKPNIVVQTTRDSGTSAAQEESLVEEPGRIVTQASADSSARACPRKYAQRKNLLDKHRRRTKTSSSAASGDDNSVASDAVPESQLHTLSQELTAFKPRGSCAEGPMVAPNIPMQALMAYGADEDDAFADLAIGISASQSEYASLGLSESNSFSKSEPGNRQNARESPNNGIQRQSFESDALSEADYSLFSGVSSHISVSSLATRASKKLRNKRQRNKQSSDGETMNATLLMGDGARSSTVDSQGYDPYTTGQLHPTDPVVPLLSSLRNDGRFAPIAPTQAVDNMQIAPPSASTRANHIRDDSEVARITQTRATTAESPSFSLDTVTTVTTTSHMVSTIASEGTSRHDEQGGKRPRAPMLPTSPEDMVTEKFVSESNSNVEAFRSAYQSLSLEQFANDLKEAAGSILNVQGLDLNQGMNAASQSLNKNMTAASQAASQSLNKLVGADVFSGTKPARVKRGDSPVEEEIAIEVEYIEDSEEWDEI
jgi:hypothetical protein